MNMLKRSWIGNMEIDWFTFVAQIINFGILLWLLNRFLYVPITTAISDRESAIAARITAADVRFDEARQLENDLQAQRDQIDLESESLRAAAREAVETERIGLLDAARQSVQQQRSTWQDELNREAQLANQSLRTDTATVAVEIASRALSDLSGEDLDDRMANKLIAGLNELDGSTHKSMMQSLGSGSSPIVITTACKLNAERRSKLELAIREVLESDVAIEYQESADMVAGIRLTVGSHEIAWCVSDYLEALKERFGQEVAKR